uniref:Uncharacterized protein n=1 Tax=Compsopogon caeruleus TaxID=31354 RepID=A0A7S1XGI9_9RHOD|mmetsp:Transcript_6509/g.13048  ORF Transcript_6509/g.13048 Transcript_6509/m.13048 type:complete len:719 (+) Transcript_6509:1186-3342(+)
MVVDVQELVRHKLLNCVIRAVKPSNGALKVLVVDRYTVTLVGAVIPLDQLAAEGITLLEFVDLFREPLPALHGVYLLRPSKESIRAFAEESTGQYAAFHLFTTSPLSKERMDEIRERKDLMKKIKTLRELDLEIFVRAGSIFDFGRGASALSRVYSSEKEVVRKELIECSSKLATVCRLIQSRADQWNIRYFAPSLGAKTIAAMTKAELSSVLDHRSAEEIDVVVPAEHVSLIILDRTADLASPLIHEYTYQAMAYDQIVFDHGQPEGPIYNWSDPQAGDKPMSCTFDAERKDDLWKQVRHMHIAEASPTVDVAFKQFLERNAAAKLHSPVSSPTKEGSRSPSDTKARTAALDLKELSAAVRALPEYQEKMKQISMHLHILEALFKAFKSGNLMEVSRVEQNLVIGLDEQENRVKSEGMFDSLRKIISDPVVARNDKVRILLLAHVIAKGTGSFIGRHSTLSTVSFAREFHALDFEQYSRPPLGLDLSVCLRGLETLLASPSACLHQGSTSWTERRKERKTIKEAHVKRRQLVHGTDMPYELSRYVPPLRDLIYQLSQESLSTDLFPFSSASTSYQTSGVPTEGRRLFIIFVLGGCTYAELRECYKMSEQNSACQFILGSNGLLAPSDFVRGTSSLADTALYLDLIKDPSTTNPVNMSRKIQLRKESEKRFNTTTTRTSDPTPTSPRKAVHFPGEEFVGDSKSSTDSRSRRKGLISRK